MVQKSQLFLLLVFIIFSAIAAETENQDYVALLSLKNIWQNTPPSWVGPDPCGKGWEGIGCTNSRVTSIMLSTTGLTGPLSGDFELLSELQTLDLSYNKGLTGPIPRSIGNLKKLLNLILAGCSFSGPIPDTIGSLEQLLYLSLNSNYFSGHIPPSIGNLSNLLWLDLTDNQLNGPIPISDGITPGLDMLLNARHFHLGQNNLSGTIPPRLFSSEMVLIHVLLDGNQLTGSIPSTLGLVQALEVLRIDGNALSGLVPSNFNNLTNLNHMFLSNNKLTGPLPNLTGMIFLSYVDISNNTFDGSDAPPWFPTLQSLTTLIMENTQLQGQFPVALFSLPLLQTVVLKKNQLNGSLVIGTTHSNQLKLIDLQFNFISYLEEKEAYNGTLKLEDNPICGVTGNLSSYCTVSLSNASYSTQKVDCEPVPCSSNQISSPYCRCAYPYTGTLFFETLSFSDLGNNTYYNILEESLMHSFHSHQLPVDSVSLTLSNPITASSEYLEVKLKVFPYGQVSFNLTGISSIGFMLSNQTFKPPPLFGPFYFIGDKYEKYTESKKSSRSSIVIEVVVGGSILLLVILLAGVYVLHTKKRAERAIEHTSHFSAQLDKSNNGGSVIKVKGVGWFSLKELEKYTNHFSIANEIGSGGYGKVYQGSLPTGQLIAIKRAKKESMQGGLEFKTEIELLSRVHHKNLVSLMGFCFEKGEQILVYEYVSNGSLKDSLSGKSRIRLDWMRRLRVALGAARGLAYLHEFANPPIIHRDIKSGNILLDESLNAKVSDFGLSKPIDDSEGSHVITQVKGTMGYVDPEYYMTHKLTEKSDVYSFGVVMLELLTARKPIEHGKYIVREVQETMDKTKDLFNHPEFLDPAIGLGTTLKGLKKFVDLAMRCVKELGSDRPMMVEVVKEIENIMELASVNPDVDSTSTSASYEETRKRSSLDPSYTYS
ncbi:probable leucine-rich repeat receptor-like protein kinase At5g49770 isoform X1 [Quercus lobata]|uniref:probable leucine-rich repeat receptor-like protein kinase At5g49770 isoform X1 n=2 Tax=Quercus lobata TaxID=97700 RepID=UPI001247F5A9|nr:probable leucine-rich repeat receptor-like protein kinase At5g49770 isoform X1 [Quercus lobata]